MDKIRRTVFIIGRVQGDSWKGSFKKFDYWEITLARAGYWPVNPVKCVEEDLPWHMKIKSWITRLMDCDSAFILEDYLVSDEGQLLYEIALRCEIPLVSRVQLHQSKLVQIARKVGIYNGHMKLTVTKDDIAYAQSSKTD